MQYTKQCVYWIPHPHKNVCRHQDIYPMLTSTGYIVNLMIFGTGHMADHLKCIYYVVCFNMLLWSNTQNNAFIGFLTLENMCVDTKIFILR